LLEPQAVVVGRVLKELRRLLEHVFALDLLELEVVLGRVAAKRVLVVRRRRRGRWRLGGVPLGGMRVELRGLGLAQRLRRRVGLLGGGGRRVGLRRRLGDRLVFERIRGSRQLLLDGRQVRRLGSVVPVLCIDEPGGVGFELVPDLRLLVERIFELGRRRHRGLGRRGRRRHDRRLGADRSVELRRLREPLGLVEAVVVRRLVVVDQPVVGQRGALEIGLVGPHRVAADRPQRIAFGAFDLGWIGAAPALEV